jgi:hypothetical protein
MAPIEVYDPSIRKWTHFGWINYVVLSRDGDTFLFRNVQVGLDHLQGFDVASKLARKIPDRKGKGRDFSN